MNCKRIGFNQSAILTLSVVLILVGAGAAYADIRLPAIIGDNMVLQQGQKVTIWGWADPGEEVMVSVSWHNMKWAVTAGRNGRWEYKMNPPEAGGPYEIKLSGKNTITITNILVGEVWICSGQSNMQWSVQNSNNPKEEIAAADYPNIRLFTVQRKVAQEPQSDCTGSWTSCNPETVPWFSAVGSWDL